MNREYVAIAVGKNQIVCMGGFEEEGNIIVNYGRVRRRRLENTLTIDVQQAVDDVVLKGTNLGGALECPMRFAIKRIPEMSREEIDDMLKYDMETYVNWDEPFFTQFATVPVEAEGEKVSQVDLFVVAMTEKDVINIGAAMFSLEGETRLIDYWPAPIANVYKENKNIVTVHLYDDQAHIYLWDSYILRSQVSTKNDPHSVALAIEDMNEERERTTGRGIRGVEVLYDDKSGQEAYDTNCDDWSAIEEEFGMLERKNIHYIDDSDLGINHKMVSTNIALGILIRGVTDDESY